MVSKDAFDPRLRTHKLKGELSAYWAYSNRLELGIGATQIQLDKLGAVNGKDPTVVEPSEVAMPVTLRDEALIARLAPDSVSA